MKKLLILMLFGVLFVPMNGSAKADEVLYCVSKLATGIKEHAGFWDEKSFVKERFTIKVINDFEKVYADIFGLSPCRTAKEYVFADRFICNGEYGDTFIYDKSSKRFVYARIGIKTYIQRSAGIIYAGTCEKF